MFLQKPLRAGLVLLFCSGLASLSLAVVSTASLKNSLDWPEGTAGRHKPLVSCMIWLLRPDQTEATEFAPAMEEGTGILPGLPAVAGKPVHVGFDGGRLTSDGGICWWRRSNNGSRLPNA